MKYKLSILFLAMLVFIFSSNEAKANEQENIMIEFSEQEKKIIEFNEQANKVIQQIEKAYGSMEGFYKVGSFYVDENKKIHINYKKGNEKAKVLLKNIENTEVHEVIYSTKELQEIQGEIANTIHSVNETGRYFSVSYSEEKQNITIEHTNQISNEVIEKLKNKFPHIIEVKVTHNTPEFLKTKEDNWNRLGAGLGTENGLKRGRCTTAGVVYKDSKYFLLTAGHCFDGNTVSTGAGAGYVRQYDEYVGRMHSRATYNQLDAGLVRIEGSYIPRYATNGIKVSFGTNDTSEVFDNKFIGWTGMYNGMLVCKTGIETNKTCGTVYSMNQIMEIEGSIYKMSLILSDNGQMFAAKGDSGGAVYQIGSTGNYLVGILSGRIGANNQYGLVVDVLAVRDHYGISLYTSNTNTLITN